MTELPAGQRFLLGGQTPDNFFPFELLVEGFKGGAFVHRTPKDLPRKRKGKRFPRDFGRRDLLLRVLVGPFGIG